MITILNYGLGNLASIKNMLTKIGQDSIITENPKELENAEKIILPGVGAFDTGMNNLKKSGCLEILNIKANEEQVPILGICLGMQLMTNYSEEGESNGLGWVDAHTKKFEIKDSSKYKVPHMGWNYIKVKKQNNLIPLSQIEDYRFYFVHSYYVELSNIEDELFVTNFEQPFCSAFERGNITGVQFHPEKSHRFGKELLKNFAVKKSNINSID